MRCFFYLTVFLIFSATTYGIQPAICVSCGAGAEIEFDQKDQTAKIYHRMWLPDIEQRRRSAMIEMPEITAQEWQEGKAIFRVTKDSSIGIMLSPQGVKGVGNKEYVPEGVYYDNIRINGKLVENGDFENGQNNIHFHTPDKSYPSRIIFNPELAKTGNYCILSWFRCFPIIYAKGKAGENLVLTFNYRPAGAIPSPFTEYFPISLRQVANMGFKDDIAGDGKGGWTDQGGINDLRSFNPEKKVYGGVPFDIIDPIQNHGNSCVVFKGEHTAFGSAAITIPVNKTINTVFLLNGCAWGKPGLTAAKVTVNLNDGSQEYFDMITGKNTSDWWSPQPIPDAEIAWRGGNAHGGEVGLYLTRFELKKAAAVKSLEIKAGDPSLAFGIVGVGVGMVYAKPDPLKDKTFTIELNRKASYTAIPLHVLALEMKSRGFPAELFLERRENLPRLQLIGPDGSAIKFTIAEFTRMLPPVIIAFTDNLTGKYTFKLQSQIDNSFIVSPRAALKKITAQDGLKYRPDDWSHGLMFYPDEFKTVNVKPEVDPDSFYHSSLAVTQGSTLERDFTTDEKKTYTLYTFARAEDNHVNSFKVYLDGVAIQIHNDFSMPKVFHWSGGQKIILSSGRHQLKIEKTGHLKPHSFGKVYLAEDALSPLMPTLNDELTALAVNGIAVYGFTPKTLPIEKIAGRLRQTAPRQSYPDLSGNFTPDIDRHGVMKADKTMFRFADGTPIPAIWGCNIDIRQFYELTRDDRFGNNAQDEFFQRIRAMGYGAVRTGISTLPNTINTNNVKYPMISQNPLKMEPYFVDNLQRLLAACHKNGLYLNLTMWTDNCFFTDCGAERGDKAFIGFFHPEAIERMKQIVKMFMDTPNPYRNNIRPADDPTLAIYEIENERTFLWYMKPMFDWRELPAGPRDILYRKWSEFLTQKYGNLAALKKSWRVDDLQSLMRQGQTQESFDAIDFAPIWDIKKWSNDDSNFKVQLDDLRITKAEFGKNTTSNPVISDGLEFTYVIYRTYLQTMYDYARSLGFKGVITANGPDCERFYSQRTAANAVLDAVSGGPGYWAKSGYGFIRNFGWMNPMVYASTPDKPVISREYGPNHVGSDTAWWGSTITAAVQKAMGKANLFNFCVGIPSVYCTDWFYPSDATEKYIDPQNYNQEAFVYSHFANLAAGIAARSPDLQPSKFRLEIGYPLDSTCYAASFRGYNKLTMEDFVPFTYVDSSINTFIDKYHGNADIVVNDPSTPSGDYSAARNFFPVKPHSSLDRYGSNADSWLSGYKFAAEGFIDTEQEKRNLYDAMQRAGAQLPVTFAEFCKVWRDANRRIEIDSTTATFKADCSDFGAFIGALDNAKGKTPRQFDLNGAGDAWTFFGEAKGRGTMFFGVLNGQVNIQTPAKLHYIFAGCKDLTVSASGQTLVKIIGSDTVNVAFKCDAGNLLTADTINVTFFQRRSAVMPAEISFGRPLKSVTACRPDGTCLENIPFHGSTFQNDFANGEKIAYYQVNF